MFQKYNNTWNIRAAKICGIVVVVTNNIDDKANNGALAINVHFLPIMSANGPATKGAEK